MIKEYIAYLRDNPEGHWFKAKVYGWGWTPATWQGWLILAVFVALIVLNFFRLDANSHSASDTVRPFIIQTALLALLLIGICYATGERPRWQWGLPENK
ncbi:MAG: hypothetical protein WC217_03075 [Candidatus Paceibacterota bacterium]|jgi:hypothetical protein